MPPKKDVQMRKPLPKNDDSSTGIAGLDGLLQGGFPKGSVVLLAGSSGSGKTIFSFQWLFDGIRKNENGIYITLTESKEKALANAERMEFYDAQAVKEERLSIVDIRPAIYEKNLFNQRKVFEFIENEVKKTNAKRLCIDSITAIAYDIEDKNRVRNFVFELGKLLASLGCTTLLTSEVTDTRRFSAYGVEEFISDAIVRLDQVREGGEWRRVLQLVKVRGKECSPQQAYFKIWKSGLNVFPTLKITMKHPSTNKRVSSGNGNLDRMINGGLFIGSSTLLSGATGTGKSLLSLQFLLEGLRQGETCLYIGFEESREQVLRNARGFGWDLEKYEKDGLLVLRCVYAQEKLPDEHMQEIQDIVEEKGVRRCAVDSLSSIANSFSQEEYTAFAREINSYLKNQGVTSYFTSTVTTLIGNPGVVVGDHISTMIDNIVMLRHVEVEGSLKWVLNIIKLRASAHSKDLRLYTIGKEGVQIGESLAGYEGILTGVTRKIFGTVDEKDLLKHKLIKAGD